MDRPWETEPDCGTWYDPETDLRCLIERSSAGHLCGYVEVDDRHPLYFADCDDPRVQALDVHGGVTYAGTAGDKWLIGFDCAHLGDLTPWMHEHGKTAPCCELFPAPVYRDWGYVTEQCRLLARQLAAMA